MHIAVQIAVCYNHFSASYNISSGLDDPTYLDHWSLCKSCGSSDQAKTG